MSALRQRPISRDPGSQRSGSRNNIPLYIFLICSLIGFAAVGVRLAIVQIRDAGMYKLLAEKQSQLRVTLHAERGMILDRNGHTIVTSVRAWSFGADPSQIQDARSVASVFSGVFGKPSADYIQKLSDHDERFVWLERGVDDKRAALLEKVTDPGLIRLHEPERKYEMPLAEQVIGNTNVDNEGIGGVELAYDSLLRGSDGFVVLDRDGLGRRRPDEGMPQLPPVAGENLVLTIDAMYQDIVESELTAGVERAQAEAGTAVMLDPHTGAILAMAETVSKEVRDSGAQQMAALRNRAVTDVFEPGSTFKIVSAAAALEENLVKPDERFYAENGAYHWQNCTITDAHPLGEITFADALAQSSNICFAKLSQRFRPPVFFKYLRDFGFGIPTGVDLPGEVRGSVRKPEDYTPTTQAFNAFGYGVTVTPLQLACAYAAIANGGILMKPYIVAERIGAGGKILMQSKPEEVRRVVSTGTASEMTALLCGVVEHGTGTLAQLTSMHVAGKTGTSQQVEGGEYSKSKYSASFAGYFPAENPQIVLLVVLDAPKNGYYGGSVSAPIFRAIASRVVSSQSFHNGAAAPSTIVCNQQEAENSAGAVLSAGNSSNVSYKNCTTAPMMKTLGGTAPDVRGMTVRRAEAVFASAGIRVRLLGSGIISREEPPAHEDSRAEWMLYGSIEEH